MIIPQNKNKEKKKLKKKLNKSEPFLKNKEKVSPAL